MVEAGKVKMAGTEAMKQTSSSTRQHSTEVLPQSRKMPFCPMRVAIGGFAATLALGYFVLYSHKKPEASALDVAKVATGISTPENSRPPN